MVFHLGRNSLACRQKQRQREGNVSRKIIGRIKSGASDEMVAVEGLVDKPFRKSLSVKESPPFDPNLLEYLIVHQEAVRDDPPRSDDCLKDGSVFRGVARIVECDIESNEPCAQLSQTVDQSGVDFTAQTEFIAPQFAQSPIVDCGDHDLTIKAG